jgi:hypothetical protein
MIIGIWSELEERISGSRIARNGLVLPVCGASASSIMIMTMITIP